MRPYQVWRHALGTPAADDVLVFEEADERFFVSVDRTRSGRYIVVSQRSKLTTEVWFVDPDEPTAELASSSPATRGLEYDVEHHVDARRLDATASSSSPTPTAPRTSSSWSRRSPTPDARLVERGGRAPSTTSGSTTSTCSPTTSCCRSGPTRARAAPRHRPRRRRRPRRRHARRGLLARGSATTSSSTPRRSGFGYTSLVSPTTRFDYDLDTRERTLVKRQPVAGLRRADTSDARLWATAPDGTQVPDVGRPPPRHPARRHRCRCCSTATARYESSVDPTFSIDPAVACSTGVCVFAIAHIRGGGELGRPWYEDGKLAHKRNTFTDFIVCAEHLIAEGYTAPDRLGARGGSAGGLLMGAIANLRPDLFRAVVGRGPVRRLLTTMLDASLPLTVTEWEEWGNPLDDPEIYVVHEVVLALRQRARAGLPGDARDRRPQRPAGPVLGAGEVGGEAARPRRPTTACSC